MAYQVECVDLESLDSFQILAQLEFGQIDDLVAPICGSMTDDNQGIYMTLRQQSQRHVGVGRLDPVVHQRVSIGFLKRADLHDIRYYVSMRYHYPFLNAVHQPLVFPHPRVRTHIPANQMYRLSSIRRQFVVRLALSPISSPRAEEDSDLLR